ncbi:Brix domain-containing protein [Fulvia fulva]|nr:Brix domain-containing protein [Fulvia fulva]KAK4621038.1 Brix domain-containing protein [Fulvia fulva]WPV17003.1 Brix domain-containing protein [Fulvia fulva]WPV32269.1 Brix domain-containing protein [Fulvia fulva]
MAKRRVKKRTHVGSKPGLGAGSGKAGSHAPPKSGTRPPKSMVIRVGASEVGQSISQLVRDVRGMMEPDTASRLKERRSNKLRDFTTMAGPLGVTHLMLFSKSANGNTNLRLALTPRGPTFHFRVEKYSLCKDVHKSMKRPKTGGSEHLTAPLLVMNGLVSKDEENGEPKPKVPKHLETLTTEVFRSLFPPINPTRTPLSDVKRTMLLERVPQDPSSDAAQYILNLRHYAIETRTAKSVPKPLRRLDAADKLAHAGQKRKRGALPNLGKLNDVSDYLLDPQGADGFTSGSESEPDTDAEVEIVAATARKVQKRKAQKDTSERRAAAGANVEKKAIKLYELGPRMRLRLTKVEEGVCNGKVMWHEYIHKTPEEIKKMDKKKEQERQVKDRRRAEQKANVEKKRAERKASGQHGEEDDDEDEDLEDLSDDDEWDDDEMENDEEADGGAEIEDDEMRDGGSSEDEDAG